MKSTWITIALVAITLCFPISADATDLDQWLGTYSSKETGFVTLKRLTLTKAKDGSIKIQGALVGFPDEVSRGEATGEPCAPNRSKGNPDLLIASFSSEKYKPFIVMQINGSDGKHATAIYFTCYMKDVDGSKVHFTGSLDREP